MTPPALSLTCPACGDTSSAETCPGCSTDLRTLQHIEGQAVAYRQQARTALIAMDFERACCLGVKAQALHATPRGQRLLDCARIMASVRLSPQR